MSYQLTCLIRGGCIVNSSIRLPEGLHPIARNALNAKVWRLEASETSSLTSGHISQSLDMHTGATAMRSDLELLSLDPQHQPLHPPAVPT